MGTACGSVTPDGSEPPLRYDPSQAGRVAQVSGRIGWIAVSDDFGGADGVVGVLDVGAGELDCADVGSDDVGGRPADGGATRRGRTPDEVHPVTATTTTAPRGEAQDHLTPRRSITNTSVLPDSRCPPPSGP